MWNTITSAADIVVSIVFLPIAFMVLLFFMVYLLLRALFLLAIEIYQWARHALVLRKWRS